MLIISQIQFDENLKKKKKLKTLRKKNSESNRKFSPTKNSEIEIKSHKTFHFYQQKSCKKIGKNIESKVN